MAKKIVLSLVGLVVVSLLVLLILPDLLLSRQAVKELITAEVSRRLDARVTLEKISLRLVPSAAVKIQGLAIIDKKSGKDVVKIERLSLPVRLWPLFKGELFMTQLDLEGLAVNLVRSKAGALNLPWVGAPSQPMSGKGEEKQPAGMSLSLGAMRVSKGAVTYDDELAGHRLELSGLALEGSELLAPGRGTIALRAARIKFDQINLEEFAVRMATQDSLKRFTMDRLTAKIYGGTLTGSGEFRLKPAGGVDFSLKPVLKDVNTDRFLGQGLGQSRVTLQAPLNFQADINGAGKDGSDILKSLRGKFSFRLGQGTIKNVGVAAKVFSAFNLSNFMALKVKQWATEGVPLKEGRGNFTLAGGIASTSDLMIETEAAKITGTGKVDLVRSYLDMQLMAQPFGSMEEFQAGRVKVGKLAGLATGNFIQVVVTVKGRLADPSIGVSAGKSVETTPPTLMKHILELPSILGIGK